MRLVLHIWNTAGVASLMSKHLRKNGYKSDVIMRRSHDPFGMTAFYGDLSLDTSANKFLEVSRSLADEYDIIHVHGILRLLPEIRAVYPHKKIVFQHHGTELSNCDNDLERTGSYQYCDAIIAATMDLSKILKVQKVNHYLLDNAVDTDLFKPRPSLRSIDSAMMYDIRYLDFDASMKFVQSKCDWLVQVIDREISQTPFELMPVQLNTFHRFVDVKCYEWTNGKPGKAYSKTGREALACGLEVLNYRGDIVKGLPIEFTPEYMVDKLIRIYEKLC